MEIGVDVYVVFNQGCVQCHDIIIDINLFRLKVTLELRKNEHSSASYLTQSQERGFVGLCSIQTLQNMVELSAICGRDSDT